MRVSTDLRGRNVVPFFTREDSSPVAALGTACRKLHDAMKNAGPRPKEPRASGVVLESAGSELAVWD